MTGSAARIILKEMLRRVTNVKVRAELLKAWLALTIGLAVSKPIRCQGIKRWLTLTMLRATGPRYLAGSYGML